MESKVIKKSYIKVFSLFGTLIFLTLLSPLAMASIEGPYVLTIGVTGIGPTGATINGFVNANGQGDATVSFEYSTNSNLDDIESPPDTIAATPNPVTESTLTPVSADLSSLTPGTRYFFRVVAVNASETAKGDTLDFITDSPATAITDDASPVNTTGATLNGTVNASSNDATVTFEYGLTTAYGTTVAADQSPVTGGEDTLVSKAVSSLTPNSTYHFRVVAVNTASTVNGDDMTFFTSAPAVPVVTTDDAEFSLVADTATLKGTVNANNSPATVTFEYGITTAYGTTVTADESPIVGTTDKAVSNIISGLTADTTYHYRVVATNAIGTVNGADKTFYNTLAPYAKTDAASNISNTTTTLNGTVNPKRPNDSNDTTVTFEYGLTAGYGNTVDAINSPVDGSVNVNVSQILTDLLPGTTYHYRVVADNPTGTGTGEDMTFTTTALPEVTTLSAAPVGTSTATLNGLINAHGESATVTFEYGLTTSYGTTVTADQSPVTDLTETAVSKAISGLTNGTTYHFRVVAVNSSGTSNGSDMTFTAGLSPPTATTDAASPIGTTTATLNGTVNANGSSSTASFEYGLTTTYGKTVSASPSPVTGSSGITVSGFAVALIPNTTYHYRVVAVNIGGTIYGTDMSFTTAAVPTVNTDTATTVTTTGATLNGTVNANGYSSTITFEYGTSTSYGTTVTADQSPVTGSVNTVVSKAISDLTPNNTYHYRVVGTNSNGTAYGEDMTLFTAAPAAPTAATEAATFVVFNGATLNATVNANNTDTAVTFEYGTTNAYGSTVTADQSPVVGAIDTPVNKPITGLSGNTTYHYRVVGTNGNGIANGEDMTFTTNALPSAITEPATEIGSSFATLHGIANGNIAIGTTAVTFEYGLTDAYGSSVNAVPSFVPGDQTNYPVSVTLNMLTSGTTYHYRLVAVNAYGRANGDDMTFTTAVAHTAVTNAATGVSATAATLNGTVNSEGGSSTVTFEYGLDTNYGHMVSANPSSVTGNTNTDVSSSLNTLSPNTTYHYRVVAQKGIDTIASADMTFTTIALPPTATTEAATDVTSAGATVNGTVNANNDSTTVTFEYGLTNAYGTTVTADQSPVTGNLNTAVSITFLGSLTPNTTYHYRVVAQNGTGTTYGADSSFFTGGITPTVTTSSVTATTTTSTTLNGRVNANNSDTTVTFEYGPDTNYGKTASAAQSPVTGSIETAVSVDVINLIPDFTYHYRVVGTNSSGTVYGTDMTFSTAPPTVTTDPASAVVKSSATLNGRVNANGNSTTVLFEYGLDTGYGTTVTADQDPVAGSVETAVSVDVSYLRPNATYHYRVVGISSIGTSYGEDMTFTTTKGFPWLDLLPGLVSPNKVDFSDPPIDSDNENADESSVEN